MNTEQRAIIALAEKEGVSPIEKDARLIVHGMVNATRDQMRKHQVGYDKMGQAQQDCVLAELTEAYEDLAVTIARALASASTPFVMATCKKLEVSNGNFTATIKSDQPHYNDLISKVQDKGEVVIALYERQFRDGMDDIQSDKDQKSLPLDDAGATGAAQGKEKTKSAGSPTSAKALAAKPIELPEKLVADAIEFLERNQVCTTAGLQNGLKIATKKAEAVQAKLAELGLIERDADGVYQIVREKSAAAAGGSAGDNLSFEGSDAVLTDALYAAIRTKVIADGRVSVGALSVAFDAETDLIDEAIKRLQDDGVISEENEETGQREVFHLAE